MAFNRPPYTGTYRKLVLAFDVGTTYSGVSYSVLDPGVVPVIRGVTRFPAQEHVGGDSKIPTIMYYDKNGTMRAAGAEAMREGIEEIAEDEEWTKVEWFKLHLKPKNMPSKENIPDLPNAINKSIVDIFADFMKYLYKCAGDYIKETHANGRSLWSSVEDKIDFVLSHPNGWEGFQQSEMRRAAVIAGLVPDMTAAQDRVSFVTEGEASLHFCIQNGLTTDALNERKGVLIVDAGGGTIDIGTYAITSGSESSIQFEEIAAPQCYFQGSVFVTRRAEAFLTDHLRDSKFAEDASLIADKFDKTTKLSFNNDGDPQYIKFGYPRDRDLNVGIRSGQLKLSGTDVAKFFEPSIECILKAIEEQKKLAELPIVSVFLVGGFAASGWLYSELYKSMEPQGVNVSRPDSHLSKAVADGAVSFYVDHCVSIRVSRYFYGSICRVLYSHSSPGHSSRFSKSEVCVFTGERRMPGYFDIILTKNTAVSETKEFRKSYYRHSYSKDHLMNITELVDSYRGKLTSSSWLDEDPNGYFVCCKIKASLPEHVISTKTKTSGEVYYRADYSVILHFGRTELKAQLSWYDNGTEMRGPASVIYDNPSD